MKIMISGGSSFLCEGAAVPLIEHGHSLRLMGTHPFDSPHEVFVGDVRSLPQIREALQGMDALVIAHMAPRDPDSYATPEVAYAVNVTGTANLLLAAMEAGIRRVVLMSSVETIDQHPGPPWPHDLRHCAGGIYAHTKVCQEVIAELYAREHGLAIASLRMGYLVNTDRMQDKYGREVSERVALDTDPYDVGEVARIFLEGKETGYNVYPVMSTREALTDWDLQHTCSRLNWESRYRFDRLSTPDSAG